jgi:CRP-like cAMP-binding protein
MRHRSSPDDYLRAVPAFAACTDKQLAAISRLVETIDLPAGDVVVSEGTYGHEAFILVSGTAEVIRAGVPVATLEPGSCFGELSLLDHQPRNATVRMTTPGRVISLSQRVFFTLLRDVPGLVDALLTGLAQRVHQADVAGVTTGPAA